MKTDNPLETDNPMNTERQTASQRLADFIGSPEYTHRRWQIFIAVLLVSAIFDLFITSDHTVFFWEILPVWNAGYGFISCLLIIFVSKFLGHTCGLMQKEDYYDDKDVK